MKNEVGIYQLENGKWAYRLVFNRNGKKTNYRRKTDGNGNPLKSKAQAMRARDSLLIELNKDVGKKPIEKRTLGEVYGEYCKYGRNDKAYSTKRKQDSLWTNYLKERFSKRYVDEITVAEINDYLAELYCIDGKSFGYVESFLKMFYLLLGQAYSRNYLDVDTYNKLCLNKDSRIRMPKRRTDDDNNIVVFSKEEMEIMDHYFERTTLNTAYLIGKFCGVRINECFGIKWSDVDLTKGIIRINQQMLYENGVIRLVPLKTRNARRTIFMASPLQQYLKDLRKEIDEAEINLHEMRQQQQMFIREANGNVISSLELINTLPNGKMRTVNSMKRHTRNLRDKYNIHFRYHYLRHTYGTRLAELNTPTHILCNQMGHASGKITEQYYLAMSESGIDTLINNLNSL